MIRKPQDPPDLIHGRCLHFRKILRNALFLLISPF
jgi:hypothetical protein